MNGADEHQIVAVVGLLSADFLVVSQVEQRQEADAELLAVGLVEREGPVNTGRIRSALRLLAIESQW